MQLSSNPITVWQVPDAVDTVVCALDDGWGYHPIHVELFPEIRKLCNVAFVGYISEYLNYLFIYILSFLSRCRLTLGGKNRHLSERSGRGLSWGEVGSQPFLNHILPLSRSICNVLNSLLLPLHCPLSIQSIFCMHHYRMFMIPVNYNVFSLITVHVPSLVGFTH